MAKKKGNVNIDDLNLDTDMDWGGSDDFSSGFEMKDDRKAITKFSDSAFQGAKDAALNTYQIRDRIRTTFPKGYGDGLQLADTTLNTLKQVYRETATELRPVIADVKKTVRKSLPLVEKIAPAGLIKKIDAWSKEQQGFASQQNGQEAAINAQLADVFKTSIEQNQDHKNEADVKDAIRDQIENKRHGDTVTQLDAIRISNQQMASYKQKIEANYQRKSLELQYRSLYLAMDAFNEQKRANAELSAELKVISKNTGLPDIVKATATENIQAVMRNEFIKDFTGSFSDKRQMLIRNLGSKLVTKAKEKARNAAEDFRFGLMGANDLLEQFGPDGMATQAGISAKDMGLMMAGTTVGGKVGDKVQASLMSQLGKLVGRSETAKKVGRKIEFGVANREGLLQQWAKSDKGSKIPFFGGILDAVKETILETIGWEKTGVQKHDFKNIGHAAIPTSQVNRSLVEVIPGLLSMILREQQITRTGDESAKLLRFNYDTGKFTTGGDLKKHLFNKIVDKNQRAHEKDKADKLIDILDTDVQLTPEERLHFAKFMLRDNAAGNIASKKRYTDSETFRNMPGQMPEKLTKMMSNYFGNAEYGDKELRFSHMRNDLGSSISENKALIQELVNSGHYNDLVEMGLIDGDNINISKLREYFVTNEDPTFDHADHPLLSKKLNLPQEPVQPQRPAKRSLKSLLGFGGGKNKSTTQARPTATAASVSDDSMNSVIRAINEANVKDINTEILNAINNLSASVENININYGGKPTDFEEHKNRVGKYAKDAWKWAKGGLNKLRVMTKRNTRTAWKGVSGMLGKAWGVLNSKAKEAYDVYLPGSTKAVLEDWKLKAGHYYDMVTGDPITSLKDISNGVYDTVQAKAVLTKEELKNAVFVKRWTGRIERGWNWLKGKAIDAKNWSRKNIPTPNKILKDSLTKIQDFNDPPIDVYVKGEMQRGPVLRADLMRSRSYYDQKTGEPIKRPGDIKGPVMYHGAGLPEMVLTQADFEKGLVNSDGEILRSRFTKLIQLSKMGLTQANKYLGVAKAKAKQALGWATDKLDSFKNKDWMPKWIKDLKMPTLDISAGTKKTVNLLKEIRDILDSRLPQGKRKVIGDSDGDGVRDGSLEDQARKKKEAGKDGKDKDDKKDGKAGGKSMLAAGASLLSNVATGAWDKITEGLSAAKDFVIDYWLAKKFGYKGPPAGAGEAIKKVGMFAKLKGLFGLGKGAAAATAATTAAPADIAASGGMMAKLKGFFAKGGGAGKAVETGANAIGGSKIGGMVGKGLNAATLGMLGLELTGLDKHIMSEDTKSTINTGLTAAQLTRFGLGTGTGRALLGWGTRTAVKAVPLVARVALSALPMIGSLLASPWVLGAAAVAGIGYGGYRGYKYWTRNDLDPFAKMRYIQYGFLPTDKEHAHTIRDLEDKVQKATEITNGKAMIDQKKLNLKECMELFGIDTKQKEQVHRWCQWFDNRFKPFFMTNLSAAKAVCDSEDIDKVEKLSPAEKLKFMEIARYPSGPYDMLISPFMDADELLATKSVFDEYFNSLKEEFTKKVQDGKGDFHNTWWGKTKSAFDTLKRSMGFAATRKSEPSKELMDVDKEFKNVQKQNLTVFGSAITGANFMTGNVDGVTSVRMKTYGLREMEADKIQMLIRLEEEVAKNINFVSKEKAAWSGSIMDILQSHGSMFGISSPDSDFATQWVHWFSQRFLPTFLSYATAIRAASGATKFMDAAGRLKPDACVTVAMAVFTTNVWGIKFSPFPDYPVNTDVNSTKDNMNGLKDLAKTSTLQEIGSKSQAKSEWDKGSLWDHLTGNSGATKGMGLMDRISYVTGEGVAAAGKGIANAATSAATSAYNAVTGHKDIDVNSAISYNGTGAAGGKYESIPQPKRKLTSNKEAANFSDVRDMFEAVSKATGVPLSMLASIAGSESGFNYLAGAGTSSAKGLFQFIDRTWKSMVKTYGPTYGLPENASVYDPRANALMGASYIAENYKYLKSKLKRDVSETDVYMAHFLGAGGADKFLNASADDIAAQVFPNEAKVNEPVFYDKKNNNRPRTIKEIYDMFTTKLKKQLSASGLASGGAQMMTTGSPTPAIAGAAPGAATAPATSGTGDKAGATTATTAAAPAAAAGLTDGFGATKAPAAADKEAAAKNLSDASKGTAAPVAAATALTNVSLPAGNNKATSPAITNGNDVVPSTASAMGPLVSNEQQQAKRKGDLSSLNTTNDYLGQIAVSNESAVSVLQQMLNLMSRGGGFAPAASGQNNTSPQAYNAGNGQQAGNPANQQSNNQNSGTDQAVAMANARKNTPVPMANAPVNLTKRYPSWN